MLQPAIAAKLTEGVYGIQNIANAERGMQDGGAFRGDAGQSVRESFDFAGSNDHITGTSGNPLMSTTNGFGIVLKGKGNLAGEYAVIVRGTNTFHDVLTDLNAGMDRGPTGHIVHTGFNRVHRSMNMQVIQALRGKNPSKIHVMGHSLGGAVATLFAGQFANAGVAPVRLYSFASPRVGNTAFSEFMTRTVGSDNIKRVYSPADPVPMVPLFPFYHAPKYPGGLKSAHGGSLISPSAHSMVNYTRAIGNASWSGLAAASADMATPRSLSYWLDQASSHSIMPGSRLGLWALARALDALMAAANITIGSTITGTITVLDRMAIMLQQAAVIGRIASEHLLRFIRAVFRFMGRTFVSGTQMTVAFIRFALEMLYSGLKSMATRALMML